MIKNTLFCGSDFVTYEINRKMKYDYVITCFEPFGVVHGGIGTYTKLFAQNNKNIEILVITATNELDYHEKFCSEYKNITVACLTFETRQNDKDINHIGDVYNKFSFNIFRYLKFMDDQGVKLSIVECPDYGAEGYFSARAKKTGILPNLKILIRLHSPNFMLFYDNDSFMCDYHCWQHEMIHYELNALHDCDQILYGNDAMQLHVFDIAERKFGFSLNKSKLLKIPHPWLIIDSNLNACNDLIKDLPLFDNSKINIAIIGRLEVRKGSILFANNLFKLLLEGYNFSDYVFHFFGSDTMTRSGKSVEEIIKNTLDSKIFNCKFWGRIDPVLMQQVVESNFCAIIYPSLFENYPNALLEMLPNSMYKLVSEEGGMPEITKGFENVISYNPKKQMGIKIFLDNIKLNDKK